MSTPAYGLNKKGPRKGQRYRIVDKGGKRLHVYKGGMTVRAGRTPSRPAPSSGSSQSVTAPTALLSQQDFNARVNQAGYEKYGPQIAQQESAIRSSRQQEKNVGSWYQQYADAVKYATALNAQGTQDAINQTNALGNASSQLDAQQRAAQGQQANADAALRGGAPAADIQQRAQQASMAGRAGNDAASQYLIRTKQANNAYGAQQGVAATQAKIEAMGNERKNRAKMYENLGVLKGAKGAAKTAYADTLRESERRYLLEQIAYGNAQAKAAAQQALAASQLDWKARDQATKNRLRAAAIKAANDRAAKSRAQARYLHDHPNRSSRGGSGGGGSSGSGGASPKAPKAEPQWKSQTVNRIGDYARAYKTVSDSQWAGYNAAGKKGGKPSHGSVVAELERKYHYAPWEISLARTYHREGWLGPVGVHALHSRGIKVNGRLRTSRPRRSLGPVF